MLGKNVAFWTPEETRSLLSIWGDKDTRKKLDSSRNAHVWKKVYDDFVKLGYRKDLYQVKTKIGNLKTTFYNEKRKVESGEKATCWEFYWDMNDILGDKPLETPNTRQGTSSKENVDDDSDVKSESPSPQAKVLAEGSGEVDYDEVDSHFSMEAVPSDAPVYDVKIETYSTTESPVDSDSPKLENVKNLENPSPSPRAAARKRNCSRNQSVVTKVVDLIAKSDEKFYAFEKARMEKEMELEEKRMKREQKQEERRSQLMIAMFSRFLPASTPSAPHPTIPPSTECSGLVPAHLESSADPQDSAYPVGLQHHHFHALSQQLCSVGQNTVQELNGDCNSSDGVSKESQFSREAHSLRTQSEMSESAFVACIGVTDTGLIRDRLSGIADCEFFGPLSGAIILEKGISGKVFEKAVALIVGGRTALTKQDLSKFKKLKHISIMAIGSDKIDVKSAAELGIAVSTTPACSIEEVADSTMSLILNLYRQTFRVAKMVSDGVVFETSDTVKNTLKGRCTRIRGQTLGIVGFGNIGQTVALRAKSFGFHIAFYDPIQTRGIEKAHNVSRYDNLTDLLAISDCITLHCPLTPETHHMINKEQIESMKTGVRFVNTSRGRLVCEEALANALKSGKIGGAALDVHEIEPFDIQRSPLNDAPNWICTPHSSWYSDETDIERRETAVQEVVRGIQGKIPQDLYFVINMSKK